jgi:hypothetical protein
MGGPSASRRSISPGVASRQQFSPKSTGNLFGIAHFFHAYTATLVARTGKQDATTIQIDERRRSNVMIIRLIEKERYSIMPPASIHQHNCRILETKDKRVRIKLDRTIDTHPPFFTVYDLSVRKPHPPAVKVDGKVNWGFGLTWKKAVTILTSELSATK